MKKLNLYQHLDDLIDPVIDDLPITAVSTVASEVKDPVVRATHDVVETLPGFINGRVSTSVIKDSNRWKHTD